MDGFLRFNCTSSDQEDITMLHRPDVGIDGNSETTLQSRCLRGVPETNEEAAAAKDDSLDYRVEQAV